MYAPPFTVTEESLGLLVEIGTRLPGANNAPETRHFSTDKLCAEHAVLGGSGSLRTTGARPHWVPVLLHALLDWVQHTRSHPLIRSAVLHYELLGIRPFSSGNEMLAERLQRCMLADFHPCFSKLEIHIPPQEYNHALAAPDATEFITLSLRAILAALKTQPAERPRATRRTSPAEQLLAYLRRHPGSKRQDIMAALPELSARMLDRHLQNLKDSGQIEYRGSRKTGAYYPATRVPKFEY